ncbi:MAG: class I SAM-dependent methyltransferase [Deltaproteobacteria bacterium]|nr:class I SAM-dependent methyltransferase [Deltaproteobacteria bacterium]
MKGQNQRKDPARFLEPKRVTDKEVNFRIELEEYFASSIGSNVEKLQNFTKYVPTQDIRKFICRMELFRKVLHCHGSIVECGVLFGGGLMAWAQLSEVFEPLNHLRTIIGFDTFAGFSEIGEKDRTKLAVQAKVGGLSIDSHDDIARAIELYDQNRFLPHIKKVRLVRGDVRKTLPRYIKDNPHLVVSLLYLDFDTHAPTVAALRALVPRIPRGGLIAFDELNHDVWPGETVAVMEEIGLSNLRIQRFPFGSTVSYAMIE